MNTVAFLQESGTFLLIVGGGWEEKKRKEKNKLAQAFSIRVAQFFVLLFHVCPMHVPSAATPQRACEPAGPMNRYDSNPREQD